MNKLDVQNILSDAFAPDLVTVGSNYWSFTVHREPCTVLHISETWAEGAQVDSLREIVQGRPNGEFHITERGDLIPVK